MHNRIDGLKRLTVAFVTMLALTFTLPVRAQEGTSVLRGTVTDPAGAAVPNAQVSIANQETGLNRRTATTTESGDYVFTTLTPGLYRVTVEASGFKTTVKESVKLDVGETQEFRVALEVGGAQETVLVTADDPMSEPVGGA